MTDKIRGRIGYWLDLAEYDLITAESMLKSKRYLYVGFMCHQVVEKSIKAFHWFIQKQEPPYTHNLNILSSKSGLDKISGFKNELLLEELMPLNIKARYPDDKTSLLKELNYNRCRSLLKQTKEFYDWIKKLLK
ncbi:MAG: HEPN domain-containing protein [Ignavibacteriales bacterium]|nr:HEPN domain-containing protein [Ignavibacteriales bacterium]